MAIELSLQQSVNTEDTKKERQAKRTGALYQVIGTLIAVLLL